MPSSFPEMLAAGYGFTDPCVVLGAALDRAGAVHQEPKVKVPLALMNRHGLIAGATGTGKTRTLQLMTEQLVAQGVPVFVADIKGDLSGLAMPGEASDRVSGRAKDIGWEWKAAGVPVEFVSLSGKLGVQLRATVSSFGPLLLGKTLSLNETQTSVLTMVFKYCDDSQLPLLDLPDLRAVLQYLSSDEGKPALAQYGGMSSATVGVLLRKMVELESQGAGQFFGEPEFDVKDMLRLTSDGRGIVTCLELADVQDRPLLWSTFMMWLLAELYHNLPEAGDLPKPKLAFFFDEAHLLFDDASKAFLDQVQQVVRLIRSKGVGVYFVTQTPKDVPGDVLAQLSNRVQHALRAHTPDDDAALRATVRTFPKTHVLRSGGDAHLARHRRGGGDGARCPRHADARGRDAADPALLPHGAAHTRRAAGRHPPVGLPGRIRAGRRSRERPRDAGRAHGQDRGAGAGSGLRPAGARRAGAHRTRRQDHGAGGGRCAGRRAVDHHRPHGGPRDPPRGVRPARRQTTAQHQPAVPVVAASVSPGRVS